MKNDEKVPEPATAPRQRKVFIRMAEARLRDARTRIVLIETRIGCAVERGRIAPSQQLERASSRAATYLEVVEQRLTELRRADEVTWLTSRRATERALDDLARSIKGVINRIT